MAIKKVAVFTALKKFKINNNLQKPSYPKPKKLSKVYKDTEVKRDKLGRRPASPREIAETLSMGVIPDGNNFPNLLDVYQPSELNIRQKGDGEGR